MASEHVRYVLAKGLFADAVVGILAQIIILGEGLSHISWVQMRRKLQLRKCTLIGNTLLSERQVQAAVLIAFDMDKQFILTVVSSCQGLLLRSRRRSGTFLVIDLIDALLNDTHDSLLKQAIVLIGSLRLDC